MYQITEVEGWGESREKEGRKIGAARNSTIANSPMRLYLIKNWSKTKSTLARIEKEGKRPRKAGEKSKRTRRNSEKTLAKLRVNSNGNTGKEVERGGPL